MIQDDTIEKPDATVYTRVDDRIDLALGMKLKTLRKMANKTQSEIADFLDVSAQQYQKYEKGSSKCSIQNLYRLATYYQKNVSELLPYAAPARTDECDRTSGIHFTMATPTAEGGLILDEARALSEMLQLLLRMPSKAMRTKVLETLLELD